MNTYLLLWNPDKWDWNSLNEDSDSCQRRGFFDERWSCGVTKKIVPEDRVFLIKIGRGQTGIMAAGFAKSTFFKDAHFSKPSKTAIYNENRFDVLLPPHKGESLLSGEALPEFTWSPRAGGITIPPKIAGITRGALGKTPCSDRSRAPTDHK